MDRTGSNSRQPNVIALQGGYSRRHHQSLRQARQVAISHSGRAEAFDSAPPKHNNHKTIARIQQRHRRSKCQRIATATPSHRFYAGWHSQKATITSLPAIVVVRREGQRLATAFTSIYRNGSMCENLHPGAKTNRLLSDCFCFVCGRRDHRNTNPH